MTVSPLPPQAELAQLFSYSPETGYLVWRERPVTSFKDGVGLNKAKYNAGRWNTKFAGREVGGPDQRGYVVCKLLGKSRFIHRIVWKLVYGFDPEVIDHINGDVSDNRIMNLRSVNGTENAKNMKLYSSSTSGCMGVHFDKRAKKWKATIGAGVRRVRLGYFDSMDDATNARKAAEKELGYHPNHGRL